VPSGVQLVNRQYVINGEHGTMDAVMDFGGVAGRPGAMGCQIVVSLELREANRCAYAF
jgi:hypothetical protein